MASKILPSLGYLALLVSFYVALRYRRPVTMSCIHGGWWGRTKDFLKHVLVKEPAVTIVAPTIEEVVKRLFSGLWPGFASTVFSIADYLPQVVASGGKQLPTFMGVIALRALAHFGLSQLPFTPALLTHILFNSVVTYKKSSLNVTTPMAGVGALSIVLKLCRSLGIQPRLGREYVDLFYRQFHTDRPSGEDAVIDDDIVALYPDAIVGREFVPSDTVGQRALPPTDPTVTLSGEMSFAESDPAYPERGGQYCVFGHNWPMYKPALSGPNMRAIVTHRLAKAVPIPEPDCREAVWRGVYALLNRSSKLWLQHQLFLIIGTAAKGLPAVTFGNYPLLGGYHVDGCLQADCDACSDPERYGSIDFDNRQEFGGVFEYPNPYSEEGFRWWLLHCDPAKLRRYLAAFQANLQDPLSPLHKLVRSIKVNIKADEVLLKPEWVPRPIHAVDPRVAVRLGPAIYQASERIKQYFTFRVVAMLELYNSEICFQLLAPVTVTYGAGRTAEELSAWFHLAIDRVGVHIIVAGDDSVVVINDGSKLWFYEGDIRQNDHSVRKDALEFEWRVLLDAGCSEEDIALLRANASAPCTLALRNGNGEKIVLRRQAERNTGGVDTTVGNSLGVAGGWLHVMAAARDIRNAAEVETLFAQTGLTLVLKLTSGHRQDLGLSLCPPSFLKGLWYPIHYALPGPIGPVATDTVFGKPEVAWVWAPLLSRLLKISKTLTDPRVTQRLQGEARATLTLHEALSRHLVSVAKSMLSFSNPAPIKSWYEKIIAAHPHATVIEPAAIERWKTQGGFAPPVETVRINAMWYDVSPDEILDFYAHVQEITVGSFSRHPMWAVMARRDYG